MPPLLSRIEREYILTSLGTDLPELTIITKSGIHTVRDYQCDGKTLAWVKQPHQDFPLKGTVKVLFSHKRRILSFSSELRNTVNGIVCPISSDIFPEDRITNKEMRVFFPDLAGSRYAEYPPGRVRVSRNVMIGEGKTERYAVLGKKTGLSSEAYSALASLESYLERIQSGAIRPPALHDCAQIVHCDHETLMVVFPGGTINTFDRDTTVPVTIHCGKRILSVTVRFAAFFRITADSELLVVRMDDVQEEDKRLLFETAYTEKYTGNE